MAINYNAGFLPQGLYSNLSNIMQQGIDQEANRRKARWEGLQGLAGSFAQSARTQAADAKAAYKADYEEQKARLQERMKEIDPRDVETMKAFDQRLNLLDQQYKNNLQNFDKSGFLGSVLGKDYENLAKQQTAMGQLEMPEIDPAATRLARKLEDDAALYQNKKTIDYEMDPQTAAATKTAELQAGAQFAQSDLGQSVQSTEDERRLEVRKKELELEAEAYIKRNGGSNKEVEMAIQKIRSAPNLEELNQRLLLQKQEFDNRMKLLGKENEYNLAEIEARRGADLETIGARQTNNEKKERLTPKQAMELKKGIQEEAMMELGISDMTYLADDPDKMAEFQALVNRKNDEMTSIYPEYKFGSDPASKGISLPTAVDFGVGVKKSAQNEPRLGEGFLSPAITKNYRAQLDYLLESTDQLKGADGKPLFPDLQKRADRMQVESEKIEKEIRSANTESEKKAAREKLYALASQISGLNNEMYQRAEARRKGKRVMGLEMNAMPGSAMTYIPPGA